MVLGIILSIWTVMGIIGFFALNDNSDAAIHMRKTCGIPDFTSLRALQKILILLFLGPAAWILLFAILITFLMVLCISSIIKFTGGIKK